MQVIFALQWLCGGCSSVCHYFCSIVFLAFLVYVAVMDAIARTGACDSGPRAAELLDEMEALYQRGNLEMKPTRRSYNAVMLAYRQNGDCGRKAEELLNRMESLAEPDIVSYNCVIGAIVNDENREGAADRAQSLLDRMEERGVNPDGRTYSCVIEAWLKRNDEKGHALAERMLQQFLDQVKSNKQSNSNEKLYEEEVWDVINAYRNSSDLTSLDARATM
jgi:pentatricopeptide repeat protein